ncbi:MAG: hypothetical protein ACYCU0_06860 [Solirubrobacteraceae bacterium]
MAIVITAGCALATSSLASPQVARLTAGFIPKKLGAATTIKFGFTIRRREGGVPSPLTNVDLALPAGMNGSTSTMGEAVCHSLGLMEYGRAGCPANSRVGFGSAIAELEIDKEIIKEKARVEAFLAEPEENHTTIIFFAETLDPLASEHIFPGFLLPSNSRRYGGRIDTVVPLIPVLPGAADVSVISFDSTIGPHHIWYDRHTDGKVTKYHPQGIALPSKCPKGGLHFRAVFKFLDGSTSSAGDTVRCS